MADTTFTPPPSIRLSWIIGVLAGLLIFVAIATYSSRMARDAGDYDQPRRAERLGILAKQRADDAKILTTADWIDQTKGTVRIPIDEAMPQTVTALQAKPVQMGAAIPGAVTAPNVIPAQAENNAPAGSTNAPSTNAPPARPAAPAPEAPNK